LVSFKFVWYLEGEREKFMITRQPPIGEEDDYDSEKLSQNPKVPKTSFA